MGEGQREEASAAEMIDASAALHFFCNVRRRIEFAFAYSVHLESSAAFAQRNFRSAKFLSYEEPHAFCTSIFFRAVTLLKASGVNLFH
jgi:hypothetical protein